MTYEDVEPMANLIEAFDLLAHRGSSGFSWVLPFHHDPIAFLLDSMSDAANLWSATGALLYRNRSAEKLGLGESKATPMETFSSSGRCFERRCVRCSSHGVDYTLELIREIPTRNGSNQDTPRE